MDVIAKTEARLQTERTRRAPQTPIELFAAFDSDGVLGEDAHKSVSTLVVEPTNDDGEFADWLDDSWWTDVNQVWGAEAVTIHVAPSVGALLHPVMLKQVEMIHRIAPWWRVLGFAYLDDVQSEKQIASAANSNYDEIRFIDARRPTSRTQDASTPLRPLSEIFGAIRFEQARLGNARTILVRLPASAADRFPSVKRSRK